MRQDLWQIAGQDRSGHYTAYFWPTCDSRNPDEKPARGNSIITAVYQLLTWIGGDLGYFSYDHVDCRGGEALRAEETVLFHIPSILLIGLWQLGVTHPLSRCSWTRFYVRSPHSQLEGFVVLNQGYCDCERQCFTNELACWITLIR